MANPNICDGHIDFENEIADKLCEYRIPGQEWQVLWVVLRKTRGWAVKGKDGSYLRDENGMIKKRDMDWITIGEFSRLTKIPRPKCHRILKSLHEKNIISRFVTQKGNNKIIRYAFQNDYQKWKVLPKKITVPKKVTKVFPKTVTTKEKKERNYSDDLQRFISLWNSKKNLRTLQDRETQEKRDTRREFEKARRNGHQIEDILEAVENYATVIADSEKYYFDYIWPPSLFLKRGLKQFLSVNRPLENYLRREFKQQKTLDPAEQTRKEMGF